MLGYTRDKCLFCEKMGSFLRMHFSRISCAFCAFNASSSMHICTQSALNCALKTHSYRILHAFTCMYCAFTPLLTALHQCAFVCFLLSPLMNAEHVCTQGASMHSAFMCIHVHSVCIISLAHSVCIHVSLSSIVAHFAHPSSYAMAGGCGEEGSSI